MADFGYINSGVGAAFSFNSLLPCYSFRFLADEWIYMFNRFYTFGCWSYQQNAPIFIIPELYQTNGTGKTSAAWQCTVMIEEIRFAFIIDHTRMIGKSACLVNYPHNGIAVNPWSGSTCAG